MLLLPSAHPADEARVRTRCHGLACWPRHGNRSRPEFSDWLSVNPRHQPL